MKVLLAIFLTFFFFAKSYAGSANSGTLYNFHFMGSGVAIVETTGARNEIPSCASGFPKRFALDATTDGGKIQLSGLLSAHASKKSVVIYGTGNCSVWGDSETINYFYIQ